MKPAYQPSAKKNYDLYNQRHHNGYPTNSHVTARYATATQSNLFVTNDSQKTPMMLSNYRVIPGERYNIAPYSAPPLGQNPYLESATTRPPLPPQSWQQHQLEQLRQQQQEQELQSAANVNLQLYVNQLLYEKSLMASQLATLYNAHEDLTVKYVNLLAETNGTLETNTVNIEAIQRLVQENMDLKGKLGNTEAELSSTKEQLALAQQANYSTIPCAARDESLSLMLRTSPTSTAPISTSPTGSKNPGVIGGERTSPKNNQLLNGVPPIR